MNAPIHFRPSAGCRARLVLLAAVVLAVAAPGHAQNLLANGSFDHKQGDLHGWITDYEWTGNKHYVGNKERVSVVQHVAEIKPASDAGAKIECVPIPLERGFRYTCTLDVKGGPYRIYFAGYKWLPGIRPHDNPPLGELRMIYKSKALADTSSSWSKQKLELPGVKLSAEAKTQLKQVRFVTLYVWMLGPGSVDNVSVTKTADQEMDF